MPASQRPDRWSVRRRPRGWAAASLGLACSLVWMAALEPPASAGSGDVPAAIAPLSGHDAKDSFQLFAQGWMKKMRLLEARNRRNPTEHPGAEHAYVTYRGYGQQFETEVRPTQHPTTPYVGILRYTERLYRCNDPEAHSCAIASTTPVTEMFRFQKGRWVY